MESWRKFSRDSSLIANAPLKPISLLCPLSLPRLTYPAANGVGCAIGSLGYGVSPVTSTPSYAMPPSCSALPFHSEGKFRAYFVFTNSTLILIFTLSPTTNSPVFSVLSQVSPQSLRLIVVLAENPRRALPQGSVTAATRASRLSVTSFVTPCMVKSPINFRPSPFL